MRIELRKAWPWDISDAEWNSVAAESPVFTAFQTAGFNRCWYQHICNQAWICIGLAWDESNRLAAIFPGVLTPDNTLRLAGTGHFDYRTPLGRLGTPEHHALLKHLTVSTGIKHLHLQELPEQMLPPVKCAYPHLHQSASTVLPYIDMHQQPDIAKVSRNKNSFKRKRKAIGKLGTMHHENITDWQSIAQELPTLFSMHKQRWEGTGWPSLFNSATAQAFYHGLAKDPDAHRHLVFTKTTLNTKTIACHLGIHWHDTFLWYKPAYDKAYGQVSPGEQLLVHLLDFAIHQKYSIFDFGCGDETFKRRYATHQRNGFNVDFYTSSARAAERFAESFAWKSARVVKHFVCRAAGLMNNR